MSIEIHFRTSKSKAFVNETQGNGYITSINNCIIAHKLYLAELCDCKITSLSWFIDTFENGETGLDWLIQFVDRMNEVGPLGAATIVASML